MDYEKYLEGLSSLQTGEEVAKEDAEREKADKVESLEQQGGIYEEGAAGGVIGGSFLLDKTIGDDVIKEGASKIKSLMTDAASQVKSAVSDIASQAKSAVIGNNNIYNKGIITDDPNATEMVNPVFEVDYLPSATATSADAAVAAVADTGEEVGTMEAVGLGLDATGILSGVGLAVGLGGLLYSGIEGIKDLIEGHKAHDKPTTVDLSDLPIPILSQGINQ